MEHRFHVVFFLFIWHIRHLQLSPKALEEVFHAWREQVTDTLGRQDIQAARIIIHIIQSMPSFSNYPLLLIVRQG